MKVYEFEAFGLYCGGHAIVAAKSVEQAKEVVKAVPRNSVWNINYSTASAEVIDGLAWRGDAEVISFFEFGE